MLLKFKTTEWDLAGIVSYLLSYRIAASSFILFTFNHTTFSHVTPNSSLKNKFSEKSSINTQSFLYVGENLCDTKSGKEVSCVNIMFETNSQSIC